MHEIKLYNDIHYLQLVFNSGKLWDELSWLVGLTDTSIVLGELQIERIPLNHSIYCLQIHLVGIKIKQRYISYTHQRTYYLVA